MAAGRGKGAQEPGEEAVLEPMFVPREAAEPAGGSVLPPTACVGLLLLQGTAALALLAFLQPGFLEPRAYLDQTAGAGARRLAALLSSGGAVSKDVGSATLGTGLALVSCLLFCAYLLGRSSVDNTAYTMPRHGKVSG
eukprot:COSAG01_NODE_2505_length_7553_cov_11.744030_1_plen_137_part_10